MGRKKYIYDPESCQFVPYRKGKEDLLFSFVGFSISSLVLGIIAFIAYASFFQSPHQKNLAKKHEELKTNFQLLTEEFSNQTETISALRQRDDQIFRPVFEAEPLPNSIREAGIGGADRYLTLKNNRVNPKTVFYITQLYKSLDLTKRKLYIQSKSYDEILSLARNKTKMVESIPAIQPIPKGKFKNISSGFGFRRDPVFGGQRFHGGIDFTANVGTDIISTGDGIVEFADYRQGYGFTVIVNHGFGYKTLYAHCSKILVKTGEVVKRGSTIARVGNTGKSTGTHLHYEVLKGEKKVDPINFFYNDLNEEEYELMVEQAKSADEHHHEDHD